MDTNNYRFTTDFTKSIVLRHCLFLMTMAFRWRLRCVTAMQVQRNPDANLKRVYEEKYCRRARCENWIKDLKTYLKSDRTSCQEFSANQFRLLLHTFAYILMWEVRREAGLRTATMHSVQLRLIKVGVMVHETARRVWLHLAADFPWQKEYTRAWQHL
jgi:hypothetical protein